MTKVLITITAFLFGCTAHAEPPQPKPPVKVKTPRAAEKTAWPEYIKGTDAVAALQALSDLRVAELRWQTVKAALRATYDIDTERGDGWDPEPDGRLRIRRLPPASPPAEEKK